MPEPSSIEQQAEAVIWSACSALTATAATLLEADPALARFDLSTAAVCGEADTVAAIIAADPARANMYFSPLGRTPLHYATFSRLGRRDPGRAAGLREVVRVLLAHDADPNLWFTHEGWVQAPIYGAAGIAGDPEMTRMLLDAGANPNDVGPEQTVGEALYHAAELPDPACAELLIQAGTDLDAVGHCLSRALDFDNPAMVAVFCASGLAPSGEHLRRAVWRRRGATSIGALIVAGAPLEEPDRHGLTPLAIARRWGDEEIVELLLGAGAADLPEPELSPADAQAVHDEMLTLAILRGDLTDARRMLDAGARVDGDPPPLRDACWHGRPEIVAELLARGAATHFPDGGSALGATRHGMGHCNHPEGGPTMGTAEEIDPAPYREIEAQLGAVASGVGLSARGPTRADHVGRPGHPSGGQPRTERP